MTAETNELLHRMEQATSTTPIDRSALDDETALLRENWLALGKLLSAADRHLDKPEPIEVVELRQPTVVRGPSRRLAWGGGILALAVAGWLFATYSSQTRETPSNVALRLPGERLPGERLPGDGGSSSERLPGEASKESHTSSIELAWDDNWDSDFAQTALALQLIHGGQREGDSSFSRLQGKFQELARDFESGSL